MPKCRERRASSNPRVYHSADSNKSEIFVVFDTEDTKKAKDFAASADLQEAMSRRECWILRRSIFLNQSIKTPPVIRPKRNVAHGPPMLV